MSAAIAVDWQGSSQLRHALAFRKRIAYWAATHLVAVSRAAAEDLTSSSGVSPRKVSVFYNAVADPLPNPATAIKTQRTGRILCVGRLDPVKGQQFVVAAIARLKADGSPVHVDFVGEGRSREALIGLAVTLGVEDRCHFQGARATDVVREMMADAVVVVVPSLSDALPLVPIEAMSVGTPVVASAVGGLREIVRDGVDGYLVEAGDPVALAAALDAVIGSESRREAMGRSGRQRFLALFEAERAAIRQAEWLVAEYSRNNRARRKQGPASSDMAR